MTPMKLLSRLAAGMLLVAPIIPVVAAAVTLLLFLAIPDEPIWKVFVYTGASALFTALLGGLVLGSSTRADTANRASYGEFSARVKALAAQVDELDVGTPAQSTLVAYVAALRKEIDKDGLHWVLGDGYLNLWRILHRAEETLIGAKTNDELSAQTEAQRDQMRLEGSGLPMKAALLSSLKTALPAANAPITPHGLAVLQNVRRSLNEYRDDRWEALIRTRNAANTETFVTGLVTYALLALAVLRGVDSGPLTAAGVFYIVGVLSGMLNRIYIDRRTERTVDDYGLSISRMLRTPVISGLAAVGGVVMIAMVPATLNNVGVAGTTSNSTPASTPTAVATEEAVTALTSPTPCFGCQATGTPLATRTPIAASPSPVPTSAETTTTAEQPNEPAPAIELPPLSDVLDLSQNPFRLVLAAMFGLSPELLLTVIGRQAEQLKAELKSTESGDGDSSQ